MHKPDNSVVTFANDQLPSFLKRHPRTKTKEAWTEYLTWITERVDVR